MATYWEQYAADEQRRARLARRVVLVVLIVILASVTSWWLLRNYREKQRVNAFLELIRKGDYRTAYTYWGCSVERPCRDYSYEKFLEDWGPKGLYGDVSAIQRGRTHGCTDGVIQILHTRTGDVWLWIDRDSLTLSYAPWPVCNPRIPASSLRGQ